MRRSRLATRSLCLRSHSSGSSSSCSSVVVVVVVVDELSSTTTGSSSGTIDGVLPPRPNDRKRQLAALSGLAGCGRFGGEKSNASERRELRDDAVEGGGGDEGGESALIASRWERVGDSRSGLQCEAGGTLNKRAGRKKTTWTHRRRGRATPRRRDASLSAQFDPASVVGRERVCFCDFAVKKDRVGLRRGRELTGSPRPMSRSNGRPLAELSVRWLRVRRERVPPLDSTGLASPTRQPWL